MRKLTLPRCILITNPQKQIRIGNHNFRSRHAPVPPLHSVLQIERFITATERTWTRKRNQKRILMERIEQSLSNHAAFNQHQLLKKAWRLINTLSSHEDCSMPKIIDDSSH